MKAACGPAEMKEGEGPKGGLLKLATKAATNIQMAKKKKKGMGK